MIYDKGKSLIEKTIGDIRNIRKLLIKGNVPEATSTIWSLNDIYANYKFQERLTAIDSDFKMMKRYWSEGLEDSQRPAMYQKITEDLDHLLCDMEMERMKCDMAFFKDCRRRLATSGIDFTLTEVRGRLEAFVSDFAMTALLDDKAKKAKLREIHAKHQKYLDLMFDYLLSLGDMSKHEADGWTDILTSPTIDGADRQLLLAALTLNIQNVPQTTKMRCLVDIYKKATDDTVRQPALVGWTLAIHYDELVMDETLKKDIVEMFNEPTNANDFISLQLQIFMAMNAEKDSKTMTQEIDKMRMSHEYRKISDKLEGKDVDHSLDDVLNASENNAEVDEWMETIDKLSDMRKQGSDLFFNGFAQLKNNGFFSKPSNWFVNFYVEHPDIDSALSSFPKLAQFVKVFTSLPMLSTDKYSFALVSVRMMRQMPLDMLEEAFKSFPLQDKEIPEFQEEMQGLAIRDAFVKLLYRFYKLFGQRECFYNPMDEKNSELSHYPYLFLAKDICKNTFLTTYLLQLCKRMYKMGRLEEISYVWNTWKGTNLTLDDGFDCLYFWGAYCYEIERNSSKFFLFTGPFDSKNAFARNAIATLKLAHQLQPENKAISRRIFLAYFYCMESDKGLEYAKEMEMDIDSATDEDLLSCYAYALAETNRKEEAEKIFYKLIYLYPDAKRAITDMPKLLMSMDKFEQTEKLLKGWEDRGLTEEYECINQFWAMCLYHQGKMAEAIEMYAQYLIVAIYDEISADFEYKSNESIYKKLKRAFREVNMIDEDTDSIDFKLFVGCVSDRLEELKLQKKVSEEGS